MIQTRATRTLVNGDQRSQVTSDPGSHVGEHKHHLQMTVLAAAAGTVICLGQSPSPGRPQTSRRRQRSSVCSTVHGGPFPSLPGCCGDGSEAQHSSGGLPFAATASDSAAVQQGPPSRGTVPACLIQQEAQCSSGTEQARAVTVTGWTALHSAGTGPPSRAAQGRSDSAGPLA